MQRLGEQDRMEWLKNEKIAIDDKKESSFLTREHTKNLLVECTASHLKHKKFTTDYGGRLISASGRILLRSIPGMELYRERLVRARARDLQVPVLVLDSSIIRMDGRETRVVSEIYGVYICEPAPQVDRDVWFAVS